MNRVRNLINSHHGNRPRDGSSRNMGEQQNNRNNVLLDDNDLDDQSTVFDRSANEEAFDHITLNTVVSESETIGDLRRQGFINRCPRFTSVRTMPLTSILLSKGFFCFPSEASFNKYIDNKRKFDEIDTVSGLGIPLYHALPMGVVKTLFNRKAPDMKIFRYVLIDSNSEKPPTNGTVISQNDNYILYKYLFCVVYPDITDEYNIFQVKLEFQPRNEHISPIEPVLMANCVHRRDTDTKIDGLNMRWYGTTGFTSPFGSGTLKLFVLDDGMPSLMDQSTVKEYEKQVTKYKGRNLGKMPIWARYSDASSTMIPKKRTLRLADLQVGEANVNNSSKSEGIYEIPWETEIIACMCMILHEYESRKDKGTSKFGTSSMGIPLY